MDIEGLNDLYGKLLRGFYDSTTPNEVLNAGIRRILSEQDGIEDDRDFVGDLEVAMGFIPVKSWFHWNHFGFGYVPTRETQGGVMSNSLDRDPRRNIDGGGRPLTFEASGFDSIESRGRLPRMVCQAVFLARRLPVLRALAERDGRAYVVQTGSGPILAMPDGTLRDTRHDEYVTATGGIVRHDPAVHGEARIEAPDA